MSPRSIALTALAAQLALGCSSGSYPAAAPIAPLPPSAQTSLPPSPGLVCAVGGSDAVQLRFQSAPDGVEFGLFASTSAGALFAGAPVVVDPPGSATVVGGLAAGVWHFGLAVRASGADPWRPSGPRLEALVAAPIYVDPTAAPGGDGSNPAEAFQSPISALITAAATGGNIWLRGGDYGPSGLPVFDGTYLSGGFDAGFDLAARDPELTPSVLGGIAGQTILGVSGTRVVLDGLVLDGGGVAGLGIDSGDTELDLRAVVVRDCATRGVRIRTTLTGPPVAVVVAGCNLSGNGGDGLSAQGALDLEVFASRFEENVQEGLDIDDLVAPAGALAALSVMGSVFEANGSEGLDVDLAASGFGAAGGAFDVAIRDSLFVTNNLTGLLVDIDYEASPTWSLDLEVSGVVARGNRGDGARFDLDSTCTAFVHRSVFAGNLGHGLAVTSESASGLAVASTSAFLGNLGAGLRAALGNVPVLASHCVLAGNVGGGFRSETVTSTAASCLTWLQPTEFVGVSDVGSAAAAVGDLENVAQAFVAVSDAQAGGVIVDQPSQVSLGVDAELASDDVARTVLGVDGATVALDPMPAFLATPSMLATFGAGTGVIEDHRLAPGATVTGDGMVAPGASAVDPGPHGAPDGAEPGPVGPLPIDPFRLARAAPAPIGALAPGALVRLEFDRAVAAGTADDTSIRVVDGSGAALFPIIAVVGGTVELTAPVGGWPSVVHVALDRQLSSVDGVPLTAPVRVTYGG